MRYIRSSETAISEMAVSEMENERNKGIENKLGIPTIGQVVHLWEKKQLLGLIEDLCVRSCNILL